MDVISLIIRLNVHLCLFIHQSDMVFMLRPLYAPVWSLGDETSYQI